MPEQLPPPQIQEADLDQSALKLALDKLAQEEALGLVNQTFFKYENFRTINHDARWNEHDVLYFGSKPPKTWEGTTIARASLGMPLVFDQVETTVPLISQALFGTDSTWFQVQPEPGAQTQEARAIEGHLAYALDHSDGLSGNSRNEIEHAARSTVLYGNGGVAIEWDDKQQMPSVKWVDLRDFYIDPTTPTPNVDEARAVIRRRFMTLEEIDDLRNDERFTIPPKEVLVYLANNPVYAQSEATKRTQEALRGVMYSEMYEQHLPNPADRKIEVLIYYSKTRIIWVLNRLVVAYNQSNPYGFYPFCFSPCFPVVSRFYAQSYGDVLESLQRYIEALINARLDELNLAVHPPRVMKMGMNLSPSQQRWRPGSVIQSSDPKNDAIVQFPQQATANVSEEIAYFEMAAQKRTGVSTLSMGVPSPSNANRTAGGISSQLQGSNSRIFYIVKNIEDYLIVPMLFKMYKMVQFHTLPQQLLPALGQGEQLIQVGAQAFRAPVRFKMFGASRMLTREKLAQIVPFLFQNLFQGPFIQGLQQSGRTIDFDVLAEMLQDAAGTQRRYQFIRPMSQQEQQAMQTPPPQVVADQQQAQLDAQTRLQMGQTKAQTEITKELIKKRPDPSQMQQMLMQARLAQQKQQGDLAAQRQKMVLDHLQAQQKMRNDHTAAMQKMLHDHMMARVKVHSQALQAHQQAQQTHQNMVFDRLRNQQALTHTAATNKQQLTHTKAQNKQGLALQKAQAALKARLAVHQAKKPAAKKAA